LEIYKQLPKKNCGECGPPTCLAFAMQLASGKATLDACPYISQEAREALQSAAAPPIRLVTLGAGDHVLEIGDETVLFRHDKTFYHPAGIFIEVGDDLDEAAMDERLRAIGELEFERVGQQYRVDGVALRAVSGEADRFLRLAQKAAAAVPWNFVIVCQDPALAEPVVRLLASRRPLLYAATDDNWEKMVQLAEEHQIPLGVCGRDLDHLAELVTKITQRGYRELVIDPGSRETSQVLADLTQIRRLAIKKKFRPFGYPTIAFTSEPDATTEIIQAQVYVGKYASLVVLRQAWRRSEILPLLTWRTNVFTDPQKPIQVEPRVYEVGDVRDDSPVYVTTNFSLTYFSVEAEVEASKIPGYIVVVNTEGTSVLTAYAAGKFTPEAVAEALQRSGIADRVKHREVIIPGHVAVMSGKLQELSGWKVIVGPREAAGIPAFVRSRYAA